jgi:hypothetical protein
LDLHRHDPHPTPQTCLNTHASCFFRQALKHGTIPFSHDHGLAQNDGKPVNFRLANQTEPGYFLHQKWDYFGSARA